MFVGSNSVFHNALIQLASEIWVGHYFCSCTERQFDVCHALRNLIEHIDAETIHRVISSKLQKKTPFIKSSAVVLLDYLLNLFCP